MGDNKEELALRGDTEMQMAEVAQLIGVEGSMMEEVMESAGGLYAAYHEKGAKLRSDVEAEKERRRGLRGELASIKEKYNRDMDDILAREIENPYAEIRKSRGDIGDVRFHLLNFFFNAFDLTELDGIAASGKTVKSVLRAFFKKDGGKYAKQFFSHYSFDTGNIDDELIKFLNLFVKVGRINEANETKYTSWNSGDSCLSLKQDSKFPLNAILMKMGKGLESKWLGANMSYEEFEERQYSDEWVDNLVRFLLFDQAGDRKVDNGEDFLRELVRVTESGIRHDQFLGDEDRISAQHRLNDGKIVDEKDIPDHMRGANELKMQFPSFDAYSAHQRDNKAGPSPEAPKSHYFAEVGKGGVPSHVAEEFRKVMFHRWLDGDEKAIIKPMDIELGVTVYKRHGGTEINSEFEELKRLREKQKSGFVRHLPTVASVVGFTSKDKSRLDQLEKKYGKPDEYAEKLYDLYNLAIYFHKLGEVLHDKAADDAQEKAGLEKMLFAAGLTRVLERMVAMLEVRLFVMDVVRSTDIPEFLRFAEALEVMAKDPLSREVEKVIDDSIQRFKAAIEVTRAE